MDDTQDPIHQFFTEEQLSKDDVLYTALGLTRSATAEEIRKAYRKKALTCHPDKFNNKSEKEKETAHVEFQRIGFAYAVLSDEKRKKTYDATGSTAESAFADADEMGWEAYFETLFTRIDRGALDADKKKYQGSEDEKEDLIEAYKAEKGSLPAILEHIPHATHDDEERLISVVNGLIANGELESTKKWTSTSGDKKAKEKRKKGAAKQAKEAEEAAKELGVWDEFYGTGKKGKRKADSEKDGGNEDGLQALILQRQRQRSGALDSLADKYAKLEEKAKDERAAKKSKSKGKKAKDEEPPVCTL